MLFYVMIGGVKMEVGYIRGVLLLLIYKLVRVVLEFVIVKC